METDGQTVSRPTATHGPSIKKCVALRGGDDNDLARRLDMLREAIKVRGGKVLHVAFRETPGRVRVPYVSVLFQVPLWTANGESDGLPD